MSESEFYRQCTLVKGAATTVTWIEERSAKVGCRVLLIDENDNKEWWDVTQVGDTRLSKKVVNRQEELYKKHRQVTDI